MSKLPLLLLICVVAVVGVLASIEQPWSDSAALYEDFSSGWESRWTHSSVAKYGGKFVSVKPEGWSDNGIKIPQKSQHYGLYAPLKVPVDPSEGLVVQYEVKYAEGTTCGGAYLKLITNSPDVDGTAVSNETPYTIMFGPDKCGAVGKVHVIFRHRNPSTGTITEKHLKNPPSPLTDEATHVYTLKITADNKFELLIDGDVKSSGNLLSNSFDPQFTTPEEIPDPDDLKPADWVDDAKIPDPHATKPEDWAEEPEIDDPKAKKPSGWLDDEPAVVPDPAAVKPEDWDDEEDGDWTAPEVPNPKCKKVGCGVWKAPKITNPDYKGPWKAPLIDNPDYKGPWIQKKIPNPEYYVETEPLKNIGKIVGVAFELWTVDQGYTFDNILVTQDVEAAKQLRDTVWKPKSVEEKQFLKKDDEEEEEESKSLAKWMVDLFASEPLSKYKSYVLPVLDFIEENEWAAWVLALSPVLLILTVGCACICSGGKKPTDAAALRKKEDITEEDDAPVAQPAATQVDDDSDEDAPAAPEPSVMTTRTAAKSTKTGGEITGADKDDDDDADDAKGPRMRRRA